MGPRFSRTRRRKFQLKETKLDNTFEHWERLASDPMLDDHSTLGRGPEGDRFVDLTQMLSVDLGRARVLDAGAGYGRFTIPAVRKCEVVAVDLSPSMIGRLRKNAQVHGVKQQINVVRADIRFLPFRNYCFDGIVCFATFYCLPKRYWYGTLRAFSVMLRPNGWLVITLKYMSNVLRVRFGFGLLYLAAYLVLRWESRYSLLSALSKRFDLHGRTEYLVTKRHAIKLFSTFFSQVVSRGSPTATYICRNPLVQGDDE